MKVVPTSHFPLPTFLIFEILFLAFLFLGSSLTPIWPEAIAMGQPANANPPAEVVAAVRKDLSRRTQIPPERLKVIEAKRTTWPDGCLGLGRAEEFCTQALVEGWWVKMGYRQQFWIYRTDLPGTNLRTGDAKTNLVD